MAWGAFWEPDTELVCNESCHLSDYEIISGTGSSSLPYSEGSCGLAL